MSGTQAQIPDQEVGRLLESLQTIYSSPLTVVSRAVDVESSSSGKLYRFVGIPFKGLFNNGRAGFTQTVFDRDTYVGPIPRSMDAFMEHGQIPGIGFDVMGRATVTEEITDEGRIFDVLVDRSNKYFSMLEKLHERGILFGSAQSYLTGYRADGEQVRSFVPGEFSFSVAPENLFARPLEVVEVYRNLSEGRLFRGFSMDENQQEQAVTTDNEVAGQQEEAADGAQTQTEQATEQPYADRIQAILERVDDSENPADLSDTEVAIAAVRNIQTDLGEVTASFDAVRSQVSDLQNGTDTRLGSIEEQIGELQRAVELVATSVAAQNAHYRRSFLDLLTASNEERRAAIRSLTTAGDDPSPATNTPAPQQQQSGPNNNGVSEHYNIRFSPPRAAIGNR